MHNVEHKFEEAVRLATALPADQHFLSEPVAARWLQLVHVGSATKGRQGAAELPGWAPDFVPPLRFAVLGQSPD